MAKSWSVFVDFSVLRDDWIWSPDCKGIFVACFCWIFFPTNDVLSRKRVFVNASCPVCRGVNETAMHLFIECSFAKSCWRSAELRISVGDCLNFSASSVGPRIVTIGFNDLLEFVDKHK
ncbi:uncharacterized protein LOC126662024 [Mercurialis annua]|uniref:uncharacterized protein LOC126662024 n=1 Tax=Mercurialis annua TaxID=3986 RepID=UPI00215DEDC0|nr:uncharacterized protein LOC126662024 [Mercurialis annua]